MSDPKAFFKYVSRQLKTKPKIVNLVRDDGTVLSDRNNIVSEFNQFYSSVFTKENVENVPDSVYTHRPTVCLSDVSFTASDMANYLSQLNVTKAKGPDHIHPMVLHECAEELAVPLYQLFCHSLDTGILPHVWKDANITPIFKSRDRAFATNYRPERSTCIICKVMERII